MGQKSSKKAEASKLPPLPVPHTSLPPLSNEGQIRNLHLDEDQKEPSNPKRHTNHPHTSLHTNNSPNLTNVSIEYLQEQKEIHNQIYEEQALKQRRVASQEIKMTQMIEQHHPLPPLESERASSAETPEDGALVVVDSLVKLNPIMRGNLQPFPDILGFKMVNFVAGDAHQSFTVKAVIWLQIPLRRNVFYMDGTGEPINMAHVTPALDHKYSCMRAWVLGVQFLGAPRSLKKACLAYQRNQGYLESIHDSKFRYEVETEVYEPLTGQQGWGCKKGIYFYYSFETACGHEDRGYALITRRLSGKRRHVRPYQQRRYAIDYAEQPFSEKTSMAQLCSYKNATRKFFHMAAPMKIGESIRRYRESHKMDDT